jgi:integrase
VESFLARQYSGPNRVKTLVRFRNAWKQWRVFLAEEGVNIPRGLTYNHVEKFITWRTAQVKRVSRKQVSRNTASTDTKIFSIIMSEAVKKGFATKNPCKDVKHFRDTPAEKPEITDEEIVIIREGLRTKPEWMAVSFEIALHQGCRLSETSMPMSKVNLEAGTIEFKAKGRGGKPHVFTTQLHPGLRLLMERLKAEKRPVTCVLPVMAAWKWHGFLKEIGLSHLCFHCTRVSCITRMVRAGVPPAQSMAYVSHATELIHQLYTRLNAKDVSRAVAALDFSPPQKDTRVPVPA